MTKRPGDVVYEKMSELGMTVDELAKSLGLTYRRFEELLDSELVITPELAEKLSKALGGCSKYWINLEKNYDKHYNGF